MSEETCYYHATEVKDLPSPKDPKLIHRVRYKVMQARCCFVKPYVRRNKSDAVDAEATCEAVGRPSMRFVPVRTVENQPELMRHRVREALAGDRTRLLIALRGHLGEIGVIAPQGAQHAYGLKRLAETEIDEHGEILVPDGVRASLAPLVRQIDAIDEEIQAIDDALKASVKADD